MTTPATRLERARLDVVHVLALECLDAQTRALIGSAVLALADARDSARRIERPEEGSNG